MLLLLFCIGNHARLVHLSNSGDQPNWMETYSDPNRIEQQQQKKKREHTKKNGNHGRVGNRRIGCRCLFSEWFSSGYFFFLFLFFFSFLLQPFPPGKSPAMAAVRCAATPTSPSSRLLFPRLLFCSRFAAGVITEFTAVARLSLVPTDSKHSFLMKNA